MHNNNKQQQQMDKGLLKIFSSYAFRYLCFCLSKNCAIPLEQLLSFRHSPHPLNIPPSYVILFSVLPLDLSFLLYNHLL
jgi:hypothetical protein